LWWRWGNKQHQQKNTLQVYWPPQKKKEKKNHTIDSWSLKHFSSLIYQIQKSTPGVSPHRTFITCDNPIFMETWHHTDSPLFSKNVKLFQP
jgi:hypothetical protein